jgi:uncharacterized oxidoreductase
MQLQGNTLLITGGSSGIGKGLAEAFHRRGNKVIIAGRRERPLKDVCGANPGMSYALLDVTNPADVQTAARDITARFPDLNCVINNAGVQRTQDFASDEPLDERGLLEEVNTNLLGVIRCCAGFVPHLKSRPRAVLVNVSSGLAFVPLARFPVYCATKAAVHSFTVSLRRQLRGTGVRVIELIPPYVATELDRATRTTRDHDGPQPMPLGAFIEEAMKELASGADELPVAGAKLLYNTGTTDMAATVFERMNG